MYKITYNRYVLLFVEISPGKLEDLCSCCIPPQQKSLAKTEKAV